MKINEILAKCDHTLLLQGSTWEEIKGICDDGLFTEFNTSGVNPINSYEIFLFNV